MSRAQIACKYTAVELWLVCACVCSPDSWLLDSSSSLIDPGMLLSSPVKLFPERSRCTNLSKPAGQRSFTQHQCLLLRFYISRSKVADSPISGACVRPHGNTLLLCGVVVMLELQHYLPDMAAAAAYEKHVFCFTGAVEQHTMDLTS